MYARRQWEKGHINKESNEACFVIIKKKKFEGLLVEKNISRKRKHLFLELFR